jgi:predicted phage tail protein
MHYRFHVQRLGPVKLVLGGLLITGLLLGAVLFASAVAIIGLIAGLAVSAAGLVAYGVRRFLNPRAEDGLERRAEGIVVFEQTEMPGVRSIEVEVMDDVRR